jgi:DNA-binding NarL/FixJ family response regulator
MSLRVLIADDHKLIRQGLRALLDKESNIEVIAEAGTGWETIRMVQDMSPDLVIMDVAMPDLNGIEATRQVIGINPNIKVLALSMYKDRRFIVGMLKAGASGYLLKDGAFEELVHAINIVAAGQTYLSPAAANTIVKEYIRQARDTDFSAFSVLTPREREVLQLLTEGHTVRQIATELSLSMKTIETHRKQMMDKLDIHSIAELTKYAIREGLTSVDV